MVDKLGSFEGVITLHDLIELILRDLDIGEKEEEEFLERENSSYLVSWAILVHQLNSRLGEAVIEERPDQYATLGGYIIYFLNKIPDTGKKFDYKNYTFEIMDMEGQRIDKVLVQKEKELVGSNID